MCDGEVIIIGDGVIFVLLVLFCFFFVFFLN